MVLTDSMLNQIVPRSSLRTCASVVDHLNKAMLAYEITTKLRVAHFLSQVGHECESFATVEENLNYSTQGLLTTFGKYFLNAVSADAYARQPERIANRVYANRIGNKDTASGDGWRYRGRGFIMTTGHDNYVVVRDRLRKRFPNMLVPDFELLPELVKEPKWAAYTAADFWDMKNLNPVADMDNVLEVTRKVNGGTNGLDDRKSRLVVAKRVLGV